MEKLGNIPSLTPQEIDSVGDNFATAFDLEHLKLSGTEIEEIEVYCFNIFLRSKLHTLFTQAGISNITESVFGSENIRDFILSLTDRASIISGLGKVGGYKIETTLAYGISQEVTDEKPDLPGCMIPAQVYANLELDEETVFEILSRNKWITTLVLLNLFLYKTALFQKDGTAQLIKQKEIKSELILA